MFNKKIILRNDKNLDCKIIEKKITAAALTDLIYKAITAGFEHYTDDKNNFYLKKTNNNGFTTFIVISNFITA